MKLVTCWRFKLICCSLTLYWNSSSNKSWSWKNLRRSSSPNEYYDTSTEIAWKHHFICKCQLLWFCTIPCIGSWSWTRSNFWVHHDMTCIGEVGCCGHLLSTLVMMPTPLFVFKFCFCLSCFLVSLVTLFRQVAAVWLIASLVPPVLMVFYDVCLFWVDLCVSGGMCSHIAQGNWIEAFSISSEFYVLPDQYIYIYIFTFGWIVRQTSIYPDCCWIFKV